MLAVFLKLLLLNKMKATFLSFTGKYFTHIPSQIGSHNVIKRCKSPFISQFFLRGFKYSLDPADCVFLPFIKKVH